MGNEPYFNTESNIVITTEDNLDIRDFPESHRKFMMKPDFNSSRYRKTS